MKTCFVSLAPWICAFVSVVNPRADACTNILVTKGASADGAVMITYACDGEFHPHLRYYPAADYGPGESLEIKDWSGNVRGEIKHVAHTYAVVGLMNGNRSAVCNA